jgi:hypothetical protein
MATAKKVVRAKTPTKKKVKVRATVTVDTSFEEYASAELNKTAMNQIKVYLNETLNDDGVIPLFVATSAGEETAPLKIRVVVEKTNESRK